MNDALKSGQAPTEKPNTGQVLRRLFAYMLVEKGKLALAFVLLVVGTVAFLALSLLFGRAVDILNKGGDLVALRNTAIFTALAAVLTFVFLYAQYRLFADIAVNALYRLRRDLFNHMVGLSLNFFDRQPIGQLMSSLTNDMDTVAALFQGAFNQLIMGGVMLILAVIAMAALNLPLTVIALLVVPTLLLFTALLSRLAGPAFELLQQKLGDLNGLMEETIAGERTIIAYRQREVMAETLTGVSDEARQAGTRAVVLATMINPITTMVTYMGLGIVALAGASLITRGSITVGQLATFMSLTQLFIVPLFQIFSNYDALLSASAGAARIFKILDEKPQIFDRPGAGPLAEAKGHVVFKNVDFSYVPGRKILKDNTFEALPGQMIGLCGPTGAGKSTIINLLTRYYDIDSGEITIDGQSIYDVTQSSLRGQVGVVLQEAFLFSDTVMANLKYAREGATEEECIEAAKRANCHDFIMRLPHGYDTVLAERGSNLSQGQRQLLTIARAMVANPRMLILDEATSNVDTRTERSIQAALRELQKGRTSFVIAHRLSTIRHADQILCIRAGEIVDRGTHDEMMARKGFYYDLYMSQYKGRIADILPA